MATWRNRIVSHSDDDPTQLMANPDNWRIHPAAQREALRGSLNELGWLTEVIVNDQTGHVIDGHARIEEALSRGEATVPVTHVDLTPDEERLALATFDPITALAVRDEEKLADLLRSVTTDDEGLRALLASLLSDDPVGALLDGSGDADDMGLAFTVSVLVNDPEERDRAVDALREVGMQPEVRATRGG